eukprot:14994412-Heterocapsa_arctica.AAC.2
MGYSLKSSRPTVMSTAQCPEGRYCSSDWLPGYTPQSSLSSSVQMRPFSPLMRPSGSSIGK